MTRLNLEGKVSQFAQIVMKLFEVSNKMSLFFECMSTIKHCNKRSMQAKIAFIVQNSSIR